MSVHGHAPYRQSTPHGNDRVTGHTGRGLSMINQRTAWPRTYLSHFVSSRKPEAARLAIELALLPMHRVKVLSKGILLAAVERSRLSCKRDRVNVQTRQAIG